MFATVSFSLRVALDGTAYGLSEDLVVAAAQTTAVATLVYGSLRGVYAWAHTA
ncbi:MAG: hypothetical protein AAFY65_14185 [Pseudomonadota bacterium]